MSRRKLIGVLLCLPVATVAWLGFRLIEQDRALEHQRLTERREQYATQAAQVLSTLVADPSLLTNTPAPGALLARFPAAPLLFRQSGFDRPEAPPDLFTEGEKLEFQNDAAEKAIEAYRKLTQSNSPLIRAGALLRLGRTLQKAGRSNEALATYAVLGKIENANVGGWPAPIAAIWSRCNLLESTARVAEATRLQELLLSGRYPLSRAAYVAFADDAARWTSQPRPTELEQLTAAVLQVESRMRAPGHDILDIDGQPITVVWNQTAVFAANPTFIAKHWLPKAGDGVWLRDAAGRVIGPPKANPAAVRYPAETKLPWTLLAAAPPQTDELAARRRLLLTLLTAVAAFTLAGAYFVVRLLRKEFALARMQEDFVAAVSHEFRTPLTTLRQLTESLEDGRVVNEERRAAAYRSLSRATHRLHRLVEDLLDFRRMQSGVLEYRRTSINAGEFTQQIAADFQHEVENSGVQITVTPGPDVNVLADREALSRALWNLLDNAVKYSGAARSVELSMTCPGHAVEWSVRDRGIGIPARERPLVFQKFYRGDAARQAGIRGTGIGLAMVEQIAKAHGGRATVTSEEGAGSVFTISIPREETECTKS